MKKTFEELSEWELSHREIVEKRIEEVTKRLEGEGSIGACRGRKLRS